MQETETFEQWLRERIVRLSAQAADLAERAEKLQGEAHHMTRDLIAVQAHSRKRTCCWNSGARNEGRGTAGQPPFFEEKFTAFCPGGMAYCRRMG